MRNGTQKKYLPEFVYGAIDGTVTTFAIVTGSLGASLSSQIILILGFANLFADGFSMAVSDYLSTKSQVELFKMHKHKHDHLKNPKKTALATFIAFVLIGFVPLISFVLSPFSQLVNNYKFTLSIFLTAIAFLAIGAFKGKIVGKNKLKSAFETLIIGSIAAIISFFVGYLLKIITS